MPDALPVGLHGTPTLDARHVHRPTVEAIADVLDHAATDDLDPLRRVATALRSSLRPAGEVGDMTGVWGWGG